MAQLLSQLFGSGLEFSLKSFARRTGGIDGRHNTTATTDNG
jgi:hypothetical protein